MDSVTLIALAGTVFSMATLVSFHLWNKHRTSRKTEEARQH